MRSLLIRNSCCRELRRKLSSSPTPAPASVTTEELEKKGPKRIFSGIQPTGQIHLGNYFGAIRQWVKFQDEKEAGLYEKAIFSIVDLHAITLPQDPNKLRSAIIEAAATILACGVDPEKSILFLQSNVAVHSQLAWVLGCLTTMPRLSQLASFKEKSKSVKDVPLGLFTYPVLQAADILAYNASHIPVGEDNVPHIQIAHHLAKGFNRVYGPTFVLPNAIVEEGMWSRVRSLRKPENKMSKSEPDPRSRIGLIDSPDEISAKLKKAVTDFTSQVTYDPETRPGVSNLIEIHSLCTGQTTEEICKNVEHIDTGKYKAVVAEALIEHLRPIRTKLLQYLDDPQHLLQVLHVGKEKAEELSSTVWQDVCSKCGISPSLHHIQSLNDYRSQNESNSEESIAKTVRS